MNVATGIQLDKAGGPALGSTIFTTDFIAPFDCADGSTTTGPLTLTPLAQTHNEDSDACTDWRELFSYEVSGGLRDPFNPWDFYDPDWNPLTGTGKDRTITLANVQNVSDRFGASGDPNASFDHTAPAGTYNRAFDRGPGVGPNGWNTTAPDGTITLADVLSISGQFGHAC